MRFASAVSILLVASTVASAAPRKKRTKLKHEPVVGVDVGVESGAVDATDDDEPEPEADERPRRARVETSAEDAPEDDDDVVAVTKKAKRKRVGNELYFRAGIARVTPRIQSGPMQLEPKGIVQLAPMEPVQGGIETDPTNIFVASIGFAPSVFRGYVAFETIIGIPKKAKLRAKGDLANKSLAPSAAGIETGIPPLGEELGEASAVPPMATVIFRAPSLGPVRAYAGVGASVLFVRDVRITNKVLTEVATPKIEIEPAVGFVAQAGLDVNLWGRYYARLDFKEMWFEETETRISNIHVKTQIPLLETVEVGSGKSTSKANPIIVQFGVGASF